MTSTKKKGGSIYYRKHAEKKCTIVVPSIQKKGFSKRFMTVAGFFYNGKSEIRRVGMGVM